MPPKPPGPTWSLPTKSLRLAAALLLLGGAAALAADQPKELVLDCGTNVTLKLTLIPAGEFLMGTAEEYFTGCAANTSSPVGNKEALHWSGDKLKVPPQEKPQHKVRITKPFYMGTYLVTRAQYEALMGPHASHHEGLYKRFNITNPAVESVSWYDAVEFCNRLSERTGRLVRLPTEAEWEYAARAGTTTPWYTGDKVTVDQANCRPDWVDVDGTKPIPTEKVSNYYHPESVGKYPPNPWGLYDMIGNMWEWCLDWYDANYYQKSPSEDPTGPRDGMRKNLRGGGFDTWPGECRTALRHEACYPDNIGYNWGFRVVCSADDASYAPKASAGASIGIQVNRGSQDEKIFGDLKAKYDVIADLPKSWTMRPDPKRVGMDDAWLKGGGSGGGPIKIGGFWAEQGVKHAGDAWYRLSWRTPLFQIPENRKVYLWFGAVADTAVVWVNGVEVGRHEGSADTGWCESFAVDVTGKMNFGDGAAKEPWALNTIVVKVHSNAPAGGIWKPVKLAVAKAGSSEEVSYAPKKPSWTGYNFVERYYSPDENTFADLKAKYDFVADLPGAWTFRPDPKQEGQKDEWLKGAGPGGGEIEVGRFWAEQGVKHDGDGWYRLAWKTPALQIPASRKVFLWFGAVADTAVVWVNGIQVGSHEGAPDTAWCERFPIEVTGKLKFGETNVIVVKARSSTPAGGIWKPVKLAVARE
jgi:formylglycine-generating enzyme required for sulfatase activity